MSTTNRRRCGLVGLGLVVGMALIGGPARAVKITAKWDPNPANDQINGYELYYDIHHGPPYTGARAVEGPSPIEIPLEGLSNPETPELALHGLPSCHPLYVNIKAYRDEGEQRIYSDYAGEISAKVPYRPQWIEVERTEDGRVVARWDSFPSGDEGTIARYRIYYSTSEQAPDEEQIAQAPSISVPLVDLATELAPEVALPGLSSDVRQLHVAVATECGTGERRLSEIVTASIEPPGLASRSGELGCGIAGEGPRGGSLTLLLVLVLGVLAGISRGRGSGRCDHGRGR